MTALLAAALILAMSARLAPERPTCSEHEMQAMYALADHEWGWPGGDNDMRDSTAQALAMEQFWCRIERVPALYDRWKEFRTMPERMEDE